MRLAIIILLMALGPVGIYAQGNYMISYPVAFPMGNLHNYSSNVSFRGISLEFNKQVEHDVTAGIETGWNVFYQHVDTKTYTDGTASITGTQFRYTNAVPIIAGLKLYNHSKKGKGAHPYVGLGIGTLYVDRSTDFGLYRINTDAWQFCLRPELGLDYKVGSQESLFFAAKYFWAFGTSDLEGQPYLTLNVGFRITSL
jgi:hypothetical protein